MTRFPLDLVCALCLAAIPSLAPAQPGPDKAPELEPMTEQMVIDHLPDNSKLEVRLDGDFNADGANDTAFIGGNEDKRVLRVMMGYKEEFDFGHAPAGELELDAYPLGPATLSAKKGVLVVEDLTGGTTATQTIYRYRYDAKEGQMRLIGLDATHYSRTNAHDMFKFSWNVMTGALIFERGRVNKGGGDEAYKMDPPKKLTRKSAPIYMDKTPDTESIFEEVSK